MAKPRPTLKAVIICDQAIKEAGTNKWTLVGLFDRIMVPLPDGLEAQAEAQMAQLRAQMEAQGKQLAPSLGVSLAHAQMGVYFSVGNAEGDYRFEIQFVKAHDAEEVMIAKLEGTMHASNRLLASDFAINFKNLQLPGFGRYVIKLVFDGQFIGDRVVDVVRVRPAPPPTTP